MIQPSNGSYTVPQDSKMEIDWDPSSKLLSVGAISDEKPALEIWDITSKSITKKITNHKSGSYTKVSWSNEGDKIATDINRKSLVIYFTKDWLIHLNETNHTRSIESIAWSPDDTKIVTVTDDSVIIWNATDGSVIHQLDGESLRVKSASWNYDSTILASTGEILPEGYNKSQVVTITAGEEYESGINDTIKLWDSRDGTMIGHLDGHSHNVNSIAWHQNQNILVSASSDSTVKIWNVSTGVVIQSLNEHRSYVHKIVWRPDGNVIVSLAYGTDFDTMKVVNEIKFWNLGADNSIKTLKFGDLYPRYMAMSPDGNYLAYTMSNAIYIYDIDKRKTITIFDGNDQYAEALPFGIYLPLSSIIMLVIYRKKVKPK